MTLGAVDGATRRVIEGDLRVRFPLVGSTVERAIVSGLADHAAAEEEAVQAWLDAGGGVEGVEIVSVLTSMNSSQPNYPPSEWMEREGWTSPMIRDGDGNEVLAAYGAGGFPYYVFADGDGNVVRRSSGELDIATVPELDRFLRATEVEAGSVVLDLRELELMDANAAQLIVEADRRIARAGGRLIVVRGSAMVDWFLQLIGVDRLLELVDRPPAHDGPAGVPGAASA